MAPDNLAGGDENIDPIVDTTTTDSPTDNKANVTDTLDADQGNPQGGQDKGTQDPEESDEELVQKLKDNNVSLPKIKRIQKLMERARKATELEKQGALSAEKTQEAAQTEKKTEEQQQQIDPTKYNSLDDVLNSLEVPKFDNPVFNEAGEYVSGGYKTYDEQYIAFRNQMFRDMEAVGRIGDAKKAAIEKEQEEEINKLRNDLDSEIKEVFTDDQGILDDESHKKFMADLKKHHESLPEEERVKPYVRKFLAKWLKNNSLKEEPTLDDDQRNVPDTAGRNTKKPSGDDDDYIPGVTQVF